VVGADRGWGLLDRRRLSWWQTEQADGDAYVLVAAGGDTDGEERSAWLLRRPRATSDSAHRKYPQKWIPQISK